MISRQLSRFFFLCKTPVIIILRENLGICPDKRLSLLYLVFLVLPHLTDKQSISICSNELSN